MAAAKIKSVSTDDFEAALDRALYDAMTSDGPPDKDILAIAERRAKAKRIGSGGGAQPTAAEVASILEDANKARSTGEQLPPVERDDEDERE